jgi:hypothetical protein
LFIFYSQSFPSGSNKVRSTSGFALFAYQVPNASEVVHLLPVNGTGPDENAKVTSNSTKLGDSSATTANRAAKVYQMKGGAAAGSNTSEVRRPVGICMNVMSTMFCRKVFRSLFHLLFPWLLWRCRLLFGYRHVASQFCVLRSNS